MINSPLSTTNGIINITSGTGTISIAADLVQKILNLGNPTGNTTVNINAGTNGLLQTATGPILLDSAGVLELNSSAGAIAIGNDAVAQPINIGTGAAARTITVGNTTGSSGVVLNVGSAGISVPSFTTAGAVVLSNTGVLVDANASTLGFVLTSNGAASAPSFQAGGGVNSGLQNQMTYYASNGTIVSGLTGANSATLVTSAAGVPSMTGSMTNGQLVIGSTGATPSLATLTAGANITITNAAASITIASTGGTVNSGTINQMTYYASSGTAVSGLTGANSATLVTNAAGVPSMTASMTNGQLVIGSTGGTPGLAALTAGTNISITNAAASITINSTGGTVGSGTANQIAYYASNGTAVAGLTGANRSTLVTNASGVPSMTASMTDGQIVIGSTAGTPTPATLTAGTNITITNSAGGITINAAGGATWVEVTGTTQTMIAGNGYIANNASLVTLTLPATAAVGTVIYIQGANTGNWRVAQLASQRVRVGSVSTTIGVTGTTTSVNGFDSMTLVCTTANATWCCLNGPLSAGLDLL